MSKKTQFNTLEVQEEILSRSDVVIEDSSDTSDEEYEKVIVFFGGISNNFSVHFC